MENQNTTAPVQQQLPNSTGVLVMGIISLVCFCCTASWLIGVVLGILAIVLGGKAITLYKKNPDQYSLKSFNNAKAGRVCGIIGLCLGSIWIIGILIYLSVVGLAFGALFTTMPWELFNM